MHLFPNKPLIRMQFPPKLILFGFLSVLLGYGIPSLCVILPIANEWARYALRILWWSSPSCCAALFNALDFTFARHNSGTSLASTEATKNKEPNRRVGTRRWRKTPIILVFLLAAASCFVVYASALLGRIQNLDSSSLLSPTTWQFDSHNMPYLAFAFYTIWDMRARGYVDTARAALAVLVCIAVATILGSAVAFTGILYWREQLLAEQALGISEANICPSATL